MKDTEKSLTIELDLPENSQEVGPQRVPESTAEPLNESGNLVEKPMTM